MKHIVPPDIFEYIDKDQRIEYWRRLQLEEIIEEEKDGRE